MTSRSNASVTESTPEDPPHPIWRWLGVVAMLGFVLFWVYIFANRSTVPHGDEFNDPDFAARAESICVDYQLAIAEMPNAVSVDTLAERADLVDRATAELEIMVAELDKLDPPSGESNYELWLGDYQVYIADRDAWAANLRAGVDEPFVVSEGASGGRVTSLLRNFAEVNAMPSCAPSTDV